MSRANILIVIAIAVICFSSWGYLNQPKHEPAWPTRIQGFCFSPYREGQSGVLKTMPSEAEIESDLALLADKTYAIRTYTVEGIMAKVPALARKYGLNVTLGSGSLSATIPCSGAILPPSNWRAISTVCGRP